MNLKKASQINTQTAFVFGPEGSGYAQYAVQQAAAKGETLVISFVATDVLVGNSPVDGQPMPDVTVAEVNTLENLDEVLAELNTLRSKDKNFASVVVLGVNAYAALVAMKVANGGQVSQPQYGEIARTVMYQMRLLRGYGQNFFVTCPVRDDEETGTRRLDVQPAIYNGLSGELAQAWFIAGKKDGTRLVQRDPLLALNFVAGEEILSGEEAVEEKKSRSKR